MQRGWIKLWRRLKDSDFWLGEKFTRAQAWVDLLMLANYGDGCFRVRGQRVEVKRGQLAYSEVTLAERWKWSRNRVRRYLSELSGKTEQKIEQQKSNLTTLITIKNYDLYQGDGTPNGTPNGTPDGTHNKKKKNIKKKKERDIYPYPSQELKKGGATKETPEIVKSVVAYLNEKTTSKFNPDLKSTKNLILGREKEGYALKDFRAVIDLKSEQWLSDRKMSGNLKPGTLFASDKFEAYIQEVKRNGRGGTFETAQSILKFDGEDVCRQYCTKQGLDFEEVVGG
jgi:uncharacterized phage protein (TIGR02220 family)